MKLRTRLITLGNRKSVDYRNGGDVDHDAMAAHALLQAIKEWWDRPEDGQCADGAVTWIEQRAAEILAGWLGEDVQS